ncbi:MAG: radical SAM protein [Lentisphaerae bacterium]|nr:radical SAM protein [Lentisphaerota bacterium]
MILHLARRMLTEPDPRLLRRFAVNAGWKGLRALRRMRRAGPGPGLVPPFLFLSLTNDCNLSCQGCWVTPSNPPRSIAPDVLDRLIAGWQRLGSSFFGILGGEPLLYPGLLDVIARHPGAYFQLFTNGTLLTDAVAARLRELGNVTPLISIEGRGDAGDERRGGHGVFGRAMEALDACRRHRLITGVATSVCRTNIDDLACEGFLRELIGRGVHYAWYYIYRPVGPRPTPEIALDADGVLRLRRFLVDIRPRVPILVVDAYWDAEGRGLCPAAAGLSHHIGPAGDIEPCPVIQFAAETIGDGARAADVVAGSAFLAGARAALATADGGCILMRRPDRLLEYVGASGARDSSGRGTALDELRAMRARPDHEMGAQAIPETHWLYRAAKRNVFLGLGAYG